MDISHHTNWEPYNIIVDGDHQAPFHHTQQWPYYLPIQNHKEPSNSSSSQLLTSPSLFGFKGEGDEEEAEEEEEEELGAMKEMIFKIAAMQPVDIDPATIRKPRRRNVRISDDPQSVAARHRRERISEKIRILQRLVPGGTKMDTASMLDEAIRYVKFLKRQIRILQTNNHNHHPPPPTTTAQADTATGASYSFGGNMNEIWGR